MIRRRYYFKIDEAKQLIGKERPSTKGQVVIREYTGGHWIEVRLGIINSHGSVYHRITKAQAKYPDFKVWNDALCTAIDRAEDLAKNVAAEGEKITLAGRKFRTWLRLGEAAARLGLTIEELPDALLELTHKAENPTL